MATRPALLLAILSFLLGCVEPPPPGRQVPQEQVASIRLLGSEAGLPASATNVWLNEKSFLDAYQMLRFDMPLNEARSFTRSLLRRDVEPGENPGFQAFGQDVEWWLHDFPRGAEGGSRLDVNPTVKVVLVPMGQRARVWMLVFMM